MHALQQKSTIWTLRTMSRPILQNLSINGSGLIRKSLKKPALPLFWAVDLTQVLQASFPHTHKKHYFDEIHTIDIVDANAGDHGYPFATNFNPEINIREVTANGSYFENGKFIETEPMSIKRVYNLPQIGPKDIYLLHHEEMESLALNIKGIKRIRFWMTFSESYLTHLKVLENVGMTSIEPIEFEGKQIVPLQFLKAVLPDPASLGPRTKGKTNIGCIFTGVKRRTREKILCI